MKVQQELMHHASIQTTMNVYGAAMSDSKRAANSKVVRLAFSPVRDKASGGMDKAPFSSLAKSRVGFEPRLSNKIS